SQQKSGRTIIWRFLLQKIPHRIDLSREAEAFLSSLAHVRVEYAGARERCRGTSASMPAVRPRSGDGRTPRANPTGIFLAPFAGSRRSGARLPLPMRWGAQVRRAQCHLQRPPARVLWDAPSPNHCYGTAKLQDKGSGYESPLAQNWERGWGWARARYDPH